MSHELYVFGSVTRGDVSPSSDIDLLVIPFQGQNKKDYPENWSVYDRRTIETMHGEGRLFSWHLYLDSICVYSPLEVNTIKGLGKPKAYDSALKDIGELRVLLEDSITALKDGTNSAIYELGLVHTSVRDIAMSASWHLKDRPEFSVLAPYNIEPRLPLDMKVYRRLMKARHISTRGIKQTLDLEQLQKQVVEAPIIEWSYRIEGMVNELVS